MNTLEPLQALDELIQSRSILLHPFYVAWERGELTRSQLATYARVYYPHVAAFPSYLRAAIERASDPAIRTDLTHNLSDESSRPQPHPELWLDFSEEMGLDRAEVAAHPPHPAARAAVSAFTRLARTDSVSALASLYAYESQQPLVSSRKADGLRSLYGVTSARALRYFEVHASVDTEHCAAERAGLARCLEQGASREAMYAAATEALDAYAGLLDGVCDEAGVGRMEMPS